MKVTRALQSLPEVFGFLFESCKISRIKFQPGSGVVQLLYDCSDSGQSLVITRRSPSVDDTLRLSVQGSERSLAFEQIKH